MKTLKIDTLTNRWIVSGLILILAGWLAACSSSQPAPGKPTATAFLVQVNPALLGTYSTGITADDIRKGGVADDNAGPWELSLKDDGHYELSHNGAWAARGLYQVMQNTIRFQVQEICPTCRCPNDTGLYQWEMTSKGLQLTEMDDPCTDLVVALSAHAWKRK
jgi:uncharacterized lipoprotein YmbA